MSASDQILSQTTAGIFPEKFSALAVYNRTVLILLLFLCIFGGFLLRVSQLGSESFGEDELNKLQTVAEYRENGLSGKNGEHPFLMKGLQTVSVSLAEFINNSFFSQNPSSKISEEAALRFPTALFGTFTALLIFFLSRELFGSIIGLVSAALWSFDPNAIGFDRIAKEDSFLLFFFLLASFLWIRSQTFAERGEQSKFLKYAWASAAAFGAMVASKYLPHLIGIAAAYNKVFQLIPSNRWHFNRYRWLKFFVIIGIGFVVFNPTILLPDTWREMMIFAGEKRIGHDSYEFAGNLYRNQMTAWLAGVPWTFYYVFVLVKTPILTLLFFFIGLISLFQKRLGDGRYFLFFWALMWFLPFTFLGGKFTRYFTVAQPLILIIAAIGIFFAAKFLAGFFARGRADFQRILVYSISSIVLITSFISAVWSIPHYRLFINSIGELTAEKGFYFPHDEFYDADTKEITEEIAWRAERGVIVANETPGLFEHYFKKIGRADLKSISLSDKSKITSLKAGDFVVAAKGRRYFSNDDYLKILSVNNPEFRSKTGEIVSAEVYRLDDDTLKKMKAVK